MDREKLGRHSSHTHHPQDQDRRDPRLSRNLGKYTCPMHPEVVSDQPGDCSKCGMALELIPTLVPRKGTIYTWPMHPQVQQDHPGECPDLSYVTRTQDRRRRR